MVKPGLSSSGGVKVCVKNLQNRVAVYPCKVRKLMKRVLDGEGVVSCGELTVSFINDSLIRKLNLKYLNKNNPTDVLSFDTTGSFNKNAFFADIIVSSETAMRNAKIFNTTVSYELKLYLIHGLLHLLGYKHNSAKRKKTMQEKELKYAHT